MYDLLLDIVEKSTKPRYDENGYLIWKQAKWDWNAKADIAVEGGFSLSQDEITKNHVLNVLGIEAE
jgi:hypothetical protein